MAGWGKRTAHIIGWGLLFLGVVFLAAWWLPLPVPYDMDFSMLYAATFGLRHGVSLYDRAAQLRLLGNEVGRLPFFVYPPWYAWTTAFLGWMSAAAAARMWFFLSLTMIAAGVWFWLPETMPAGKRLVRSALSLLWLPVIGLLVVGQYVPPLLLGAGLFLAGWRRQRASWLVVGLLLWTFKPHLGVFLWLAAAVLFWQGRERRFVPTAIACTAAGLLMLVAVSFFIQPDWPTAYWQALRSFGAQDSFAVCDQCAGMGAYLARWWFGAPYIAQIGKISLGLALALGLVFLRFRRVAARWTAAAWLSFAILCALLLNPYSMNYDYALLLLPAWRRQRSWQMIGGGLTLGWLSLLGGRAGVNLFALGVMMFLLVELFWEFRDDAR